jgi:hypothetical protein
MDIPPASPNISLDTSLDAFKAASSASLSRSLSLDIPDYQPENFPATSESKLHPNYRNFDPNDVAMAIIKSGGQLSLEEIAASFALKPTTLSRLIGTDAFQTLLIEKAKETGVEYKGIKAELNSKTMGAMTLALDRLIERLSVTNNVTELLTAVKQFSAMLGMEKQSSTAIQVNNYGVSGTHLREAAMTFNQQPAQLN